MKDIEGITLVLVFVTMMMSYGSLLTTCSLQRDITRIERSLP